MDYRLLERYEETQGLPLWLKAALWIVPFAIAWGAYTMLAGPQSVRAMGYGFAALAVVMFWLCFAFARMRIRIADGTLEIGYGPSHPRVRIEDIEWIAREPITLLRYGGIGIRMGAGAVCYNTRFGDGVRVRSRGRKRDLVFTTDNPDAVARALGRDLRPEGWQG